MTCESDRCKEFSEVKAMWERGDRFLVRVDNLSDTYSTPVLHMMYDEAHAMSFMRDEAERLLVEEEDVFSLDVRTMHDSDERGCYTVVRNFGLMA